MISGAFSSLFDLDIQKNKRYENVELEYLNSNR